MITETPDLFLASITPRFDRLAEQTSELRLNVIKMAAYLKTGSSLALYDECLATCRAAGLDSTSPIATFRADIANVINEVIDANK